MDALSRLDLVGIIEYGWGTAGVDWRVHPLVKLGDGARSSRRSTSCSSGTCRTFDPSLQLGAPGAAERDRRGSAARDRDLRRRPEPGHGGAEEVPGQRRDDLGGGRVPALGGDTNTLSDMAKSHRGRALRGEHAGGEPGDAAADLHQGGADGAALADLGGRALQPQGSSTRRSETMRGIDGVPPISGYVVTAEREGLSAGDAARARRTTRSLAQWQYGLGQGVAFTSDATTRWAPAWVAWGGFKAVLGAARPLGDAARAGRRTCA